MKYDLFFLAVIVGTASGLERIVAVITGYREDEDFCTTPVFYSLYGVCVDDKASDLGAQSCPVQRRELRVNRALCPSYCSAKYPKGTWCYTQRVSWLIYKLPQPFAMIKKTAENPCLGNQENITVEIFTESI
jgi:hypothetical protein